MNKYKEKYINIDNKNFLLYLSNDNTEVILPDNIPFGFYLVELIFNSRIITKITYKHLTLEKIKRKWKIK